MSAPTVSRLVKKPYDAMRVNPKERAARSQHPDRDTQFPYIEAQKAARAAVGGAIIIVDTKQKDLIDNCKKAGQT